MTTPVLRQPIPAGKRGHNHRWTEEEVDIVRRDYRGTDESAIQIAAKLTYLSGSRVTKYAVKGKVQMLGIGKTKRPWSPQELERLAELVTQYPLETVARMMKRSRTSVRVKCTRMGYSTRVRDGWYTKREVCQILGVDHKKVQAWIDAGALKAGPHGERQPQKNGMAMWHIRAADLREFIIGHAFELTGRNVDLFAIVNLVLEAGE